MYDSLSSGVSATEAWSELNSKIEDLPDYMKQDAIDSIKSTQVKYATDEGIYQWNLDKDQPLEVLEERRASILNGEL